VNTLAPSDSDPINALRSHRNNPSCATASATPTATTVTSTNSTTAEPPSRSRRLLKADLVQEPGDDVAQRLAGDTPQHHHQGESH